MIDLEQKQKRKMKVIKGFLLTSFLLVTFISCKKGKTSLTPCEHNTAFQGCYSLDGGDSVIFNVGFNLDNLSEKEPDIVYMPKSSDFEELKKQMESLGKTLVTNRNFDIDRYRKQNAYFEVIDGYNAKIVVPRQGDGLVGVFIDSLNHDCMGDVCDNVQFNFYGSNIKKEDQVKLLKIIRSLKFEIVDHNLIWDFEY